MTCRSVSSADLAGQACRLPISRLSLFDGPLVCFTKRQDCLVLRRWTGHFRPDPWLRCRDPSACAALFPPSQFADYLTSTRATFHLISSPCNCITHRCLQVGHTASFLLLGQLHMPVHAPFRNVCLKEPRHELDSEGKIACDELKPSARVGLRVD